MAESSDIPVSKNANVDLGPLALAISGGDWRFQLSNPNEMLLELPSDYEELLARRLAELSGDSPPPRLVMDMENITAISSRQLGLMLALRKTCDAWSGRVRVVNISPAVRRLLDLTRTERFFDVEPA